MHAQDGEASEDQIVVVEKRVTAPLVWATFMAVLCSIQFGWNNANMNTPSAAMRADLGLLAVFPETNVRPRPRVANSPKSLLPQFATPQLASPQFATPQFASSPFAPSGDLETRMLVPIQSFLR
eukprot:6199904-Pleurochrysis_carterae.AAC.1